MQCQKCKSNKASLRFKQFINGEEKIVHLCEGCAQEKGYIPSQNESYTLHDLLTGLFNFDPTQFGSQPMEKRHQGHEIVCPTCQMSFTDFKKSGKFGCATCYEVFSNKIDPILRRIHAGNTEHLGKIPVRIGHTIKKKKQIEGYRLELKELIEKEAFEEAAVMRDKIRAMELETNEEKEGDVR